MSDLVSITTRLNAVGEPEHGSWIVALEEKDLPSYVDSWEVFNSDADYEPLLSDIRSEPLAEFIAHAPEDIRYLLERVGELEAQRDAVLTLHRRGMVYTSGSTNPKHKPSTEFRCTDDHVLWPCATVTALGGTT